MTGVAPASSADERRGLPSLRLAFLLVEQTAEPFRQLLLRALRGTAKLLCRALCLLSDHCQAGRLCVKAAGAEALVTLASAIFIAPYFFLSALGGELVQELAKARQIIAKVGGAEEAAAAVEEQHRATQAMQDQIQKLEQVLRVVFELPATADVTQLSQKSQDNWDSLGHVKLTTALESEFNVSIDTADSMRIDSYEAIRQLLEERGA